MRKKSAGLLSLVVAAGLGTTLGMPAVSAHAPAPRGSQRPSQRRASGPDSGRAPRGRPDELPNPLEDKRRALRQEALTELLNGKGKVEKRGASTVMKVGSSPHRAGRSTPRAGLPRQPSRRTSTSS